MEEVWTKEEWDALERRTRARALGARSERARWTTLNKEARRVMRRFTTSFFIVSRFLPRAKREEVEAIYAAVRFPDEVVDTFALAPSEQEFILERWRKCYEIGLASQSLDAALKTGVPCFLAPFAKVVRERSIPPEHYCAFLDAMLRDTNPRPFQTLDDLIENYIYGSAIVVGYFLTHVYGSRTELAFNRALDSARSLGIALQLTNFLRDVADDQRRGRVYLPQDMLREAGIEKFDAHDEAQQPAIYEVRRRLAKIADGYYAQSLAGLDSFSPDCQLAIRACIEVYGRLNERIVANGRNAFQRESVPLFEKFRFLPPSKYWRIPLAYFFN